jgi:hypothetical protein
VNGIELFLIADRRHFESIAAYPATGEFSDTLRAVLPGAWWVQRNDVWLMAGREGLQIPQQGFKIHVSASPLQAAETLRRVAAVCVEEGAMFKCAADTFLLGMLNSKRCARGSGGKFMTLYPHDLAHFRRLIERVHQATSDMDGPYILSDRRYPGSRVVFYRFGGFLPTDRLRPDGTRAQVIEAAGAEHTDERTPFFSLPAGVVDPFPDQPEAPEPCLLATRFQITEALAFSNSGGVYSALDRETGATVVIKEARPLTHFWSDGEAWLDAVSLLRREHEVLERFAHLGVFPRPVAFFRSWEHWFLAQEFVQGVPLTRFRARDDVIVTASLHEPRKVQRFCEIFRSVGLGILDAVERVHAAGGVIGDLSSNNVFVDPESHAVRIIDVESVCEPREEGIFGSFARSWFTPGFRRAGAAEEAAPLSPADDVYAVGMLLYGMILPVESFCSLHPAAAHRFLDRFVEAGLPSFTVRVVQALLENRASDAREMLLR